MAIGIVWRGRHDALKVIKRALQVCRIVEPAPLPVVPSAQIRRKDVRAELRVAFRGGECLGKDLQLQRICHVSADFRLYGKHVAELAFKRFRPHVRLVADVDQLRGHPHALAGLANAPFQDVLHTKLFADRRNRLGRGFVLHGRCARDHAKAIGSQSTKSRNDLLVKAIDEVFLLHSPGEILQGKRRQHDLARLVRSPVFLSKTRK